MTEKNANHSGTDQFTNSHQFARANTAATHITLAIVGLNLHAGPKCQRVALVMKMDTRCARNIAFVCMHTILSGVSVLIPLCYRTNLGLEGNEPCENADDTQNCFVRAPRQLSRRAGRISWGELHRGQVRNRFREALRGAGVDVVSNDLNHPLNHVGETQLRHCRLVSLGNVCILKHLRRRYE